MVDGGVFDLFDARMGEVAGFVAAAAAQVVEVQESLLVLGAVDDEPPALLFSLRLWVLSAGERPLRRAQIWRWPAATVIGFCVPCTASSSCPGWPSYIRSTSCAWCGCSSITSTTRNCTPCPDRPLCTRSPVNARFLTFRAERQFHAQQQIRDAQTTEQWHQRYAIRAGVEATMAQASARSDAHRTRYKGTAKTELQHIFTACALNLIHIYHWITGTPLQKACTSRIAMIAAATATWICQQSPRGSNLNYDLYVMLDIHSRYVVGW